MASICGNCSVVSWKDVRLAQIEADKYAAYFPEEKVAVIERKDGRFIVEIRDEDGFVLGCI